MGTPWPLAVLPTSAGCPVLCQLKLGLCLCGRAHRDGLKHAEPCAVTAHPLVLQLVGAEGYESD